MTCPKGTAGFSRDGDPEDVFWTVNGRSLEELGEKHVRTINGGKTLEVRETRDSDMGAYRCSKGDTPNEDTYLFKVEVMGKCNFFFFFLFLVIPTLHNLKLR